MLGFGSIVAFGSGLRVGIHGGLHRHTAMNRCAHIGKYRVQCRQTQQDILPVTGIAHQAYAPDSAGHRSQTGTNFKPVFG